MRRIVGVLGELLVTLGAIVLLFVAWQLWWTDVVSGQETSSAVAAMEQQWSAPTATATAQPKPADAVPRDAIAVMRVPRFGSKWAQPIVQGTAYEQLARGVGHYIGTANPGAIGNFAIAGHRTTYGRPFHNIDTLIPGDRIVIETADTIYVYEMTSNEIVRPTQTQVIAPVPGEPGAEPTEAVLTMTSCHPKYAATYRFIVHAKLAATVPRAEWNPDQWLVVEGR